MLPTSILTWTEMRQRRAGCREQMRPCRRLLVPRDPRGTKGLPSRELESESLKSHRAQESLCTGILSDGSF